MTRTMLEGQMEHTERQDFQCQGSFEINVDAVTNNVSLLLAS